MEIFEPVFEESIEYKKIDDDIAYIKIGTFTDMSTHTKFKSAIETLKPKGIIIDVRDNGG